MNPVVLVLGLEDSLQRCHDPGSIAIMLLKPMPARNSGFLGKPGVRDARQVRCPKLAPTRRRPKCAFNLEGVDRKHALRPFEAPDQARAWRGAIGR